MLLLLPAGLAGDYSFGVGKKGEGANGTDMAHLQKYIHQYWQEHQLFGDPQHVCVSECRVFRLHPQHALYICPRTGNPHICSTKCSTTMFSKDGHIVCYLTGQCVRVTNLADEYGDDQEMNLLPEDADHPPAPTALTSSPVYTSAIDDHSLIPTQWSPAKRKKEQIKQILSQLLYSPERTVKHWNNSQEIRRELTDQCRQEYHRYLKNPLYKKNLYLGNIQRIFELKTSILKKHHHFQLIPADAMLLDKYTEIIFALLQILEEVRSTEHHMYHKQWNLNNVILNLIYFIPEGFTYHQYVIIPRIPYLKEHLPSPEFLAYFSYSSNITEWHKHFRLMLDCYFSKNRQRIEEFCTVLKAHII